MKKHTGMLWKNQRRNFLKFHSTGNGVDFTLLARSDVHARNESLKFQFLKIFLMVELFENLN